MLWRIFLVLLLVTAVLRPWRNAAPQDDAAYSSSAVAMLNGEPRHAGTIAMNATQFALGMATLQFTPAESRVGALNALTWTVFVIFVCIFAGMTSLHWLLLISFFGFPLFFQYGSIYHGETYAAALLVLLIGCVSGQFFSRQRPLRIALGFVLSLLLGTQLQNMAAFPLFWGAFLFMRKDADKLFAASLIVGALGSVVAFGLVPHTPYQSSYAYWLKQYWVELGGAAPLHAVLYAVQLVVGLGLFLIPFLQWSKRSMRDWLVGGALHVCVYVVLFLAPIAALSAGIFFTDYFPRFFAVFFISIGAWGWWGIWPLVRKLEIDRENLPVYGTVAALGAMLVFSVFRFCLDLRYIMSWCIPIAFHLRGPLELSRPIGEKLWYAVPVLAVSLFLNSYLMNTTEARWRTADELAATGTPRNQISGGYGWNTYYTASDCIYAAIKKIETQLGTSDIYKRREFFDRVVNQYGRSHEDGWVPKYIIKPQKLFGYSLNLQKYRMPGQDAPPMKTVNYSVFGLPCALAVFENPNPVPAWCDQN